MKATVHNDIKPHSKSSQLWTIIRLLLALHTVLFPDSKTQATPRKFLLSILTSLSSLRLPLTICISVAVCTSYRDSMKEGVSNFVVCGRFLRGNVV